MPVMEDEPDIAARIPFAGSFDFLHSFVF